MLKQIESVEQDMNKVQDQVDYWMNVEPFNEDKVEEYEQKSDVLYEKLFDLTEKAADLIVSTNPGSIDRKTARIMISARRKDLKRIFA